MSGTMAAAVQFCRYGRWSKCIILVIVLFVHSTRCHLNDIMKTDEVPTIGDAISSDKTFHFLSTGVSHIFWSYVASSNFTSHRDISISCKSALDAVSSGMSDGDILPFHFVDASAKTPPGFIRASMSSFGDFDQCLAIDGTVKHLKMAGKYCAFDLFPVRVDASNDRKSGDLMATGKLTFDRIAVLKRIAFIFSLCIPDQCTEVDLKQILLTGESLKK